MSEPKPIDFEQKGYGDFHDELPLWSAPFGLLLLEQVPMARGLRILDVGAGTGWLSVELAQRCASCEVIAVDPWQAGVDRLRRKIEFLGLSNLNVLESDAAALDLADDSIDLIVSNLGINNFEDPRAVLERCHRAARLGAELVLTTNLAGHMKELYELYRSVLTELELDDRLAVLDRHIAHRGTVASVSALLEATGFSLEETVERSFTMRFSDGSSLFRHLLIRLGFLPAWRSIPPRARADRVLTLLENRLNELAGQRGELGLTIPFACLRARKRPR